MPGISTPWGVTKSLLWFLGLSFAVWYFAASFDGQDFINRGGQITEGYLDVMEGFTELTILPDSWGETFKEWRKEIPAHIEVVKYNNSDALNLVYKIWAVTAIVLWAPIFVITLISSLMGGGARVLVNPANPAPAPAPAGVGGGGRPATNEHDVALVRAKIIGTIGLISFILLVLWISSYTVIPKGIRMWEDEDNRMQIGPSWFEPSVTGLGAIILIVAMVAIPFVLVPKFVYSAVHHGGGVWTDRHFVYAGIGIAAIFALELYVFKTIGLL